MSRLPLLLVLLALMLAPACTRRETSPESVSPRPRPAWVKQGIVMAGNWEPLTFIRRRGGESLADVAAWKGERTEEAARGMKQAGINLVITNLHKGFGLKAEQEDIDATRRFTAFAHKQGMRVGGYIGASMMYETFFAEEPSARRWMQIDEWGRPIYYTNTQSFRYMACRNNPGYDSFVRKVLRLGIQDVGLDLIHFDQMEGWSEPLSCRCPDCQRQFRRFLRANYSGDRAIERFGFARFDDVIAPPFGQVSGSVGFPTLDNPMMQEWTRFRAWSFARKFGEYDSYIHSLNPSVALEGNPNLHPSANIGFSHGVDVPQMLQYGDVVWSEDPNHASWTEDKRLISKIRNFKMARIMGKSIFVYTGGRYGADGAESPPHLRLAEAMAFNDMNLGMVGDVKPDGIELTPEARRYVDFFLAHRETLSSTRTMADAAVLRSFASLEFNPSAVLPQVMLAEQTLIQNKIPFDIVFDEHLKDLSRYKVLILANQEALTEEQVRAIRSYVTDGGGVVATGNTSLLTGWRLKRDRFAMADMFGIDLPPTGKSAAPVRNSFGKGRVVYFPALEPAVDSPDPRMSYDFPNRYWHLPRNYAAFVEALRWAAGGSGVTVDAPLSVAAEWARQEGTGTLLLHLVNYDFAKPVRNVTAKLHLQPGFYPGSVTLESPDSGQKADLTPVVKDGEAEVRIPELGVYSLIVWKNGPARQPVAAAPAPVRTHAAPSARTTRGRHRARRAGPGR